MALTDDAAVVLSGPLAQRAQLRRILNAQGFHIPQLNSHNPTELGPSADPDEDLDPAGVGWLVVQTDDLEGVEKAIESNDWVIRQHWTAVGRVDPLLEDQDDESPRVKALEEQVSDLVLQIAELKGKQ